jgi:hypothetical protein
MCAALVATSILYKWGDVGQVEFEEDNAAIEAEMAM